MAENNTATVLILHLYWCSGRMAQWSEAALFQLVEVGVQVQIPAWLLAVCLFVFFSFIVYLRFGFLLFILTAYPVSLARFLRKHISSYVKA